MKNHQTRHVFILIHFPLYFWGSRCELKHENADHFTGSKVSPTSSLRIHQNQEKCVKFTTRHDLTVVVGGERQTWGRGSKRAVWKHHSSCYLFSVYLHRKLWFYIKSNPLIKASSLQHKDYGLWRCRAKALRRTVLPQTAINNDATTKFFFSSSSCVCWMLFCSFVIRWEMLPAFSAFKSSPETSWVGGFWPIWRRSSCCEKDIIIIRGCDLDTCLFQMGEMIEGRLDVEVSCGPNGTVLTAEKWL